MGGSTPNLTEETTQVQLDIKYIDVYRFIDRQSYRYLDLQIDKFIDKQIDIQIISLPTMYVKQFLRKQIDVDIDRDNRESFTKTTQSEQKIRRIKIYEQ